MQTMRCTRILALAVAVCGGVSCADMDGTAHSSANGGDDGSAAPPPPPAEAREDGPNAPGPGGETTAAGSASESATSDPVADTVNSRPSFEGIPNFEDVVALRDGDWLILLSSVDGVHVRAPGPGQAAGSLMEASHPELADVQQRVWNDGHIPWIIASDEVPRMDPGRTLLILGPHPRAVAERRLQEVEPLVPGARLVRGW